MGDNNCVLVGEGSRLIKREEGVSGPRYLLHAVLLTDKNCTTCWKNSAILYGCTCLCVCQYPVHRGERARKLLTASSESSTHQPTHCTSGPPSQRLPHTTQVWAHVVYNKKTRMNGSTNTLVSANDQCSRMEMFSSLFKILHNFTPVTYFTM